MKTINAIYRDESTGICERGQALIDDNGTPVTAYGYELTQIEDDTVSGWGEPDGIVEQWAHCAGAYTLMFNRASVQS